MAAAKDPYRYFRIEAAELHEQLGQGILALETGQTPDATLALLLRLAHTLKGAARVVKLPQIADEAHAIEDVLTPLRGQPGVHATREQIEALLALHDQFGQQLADLAQPAATTAAVPAVAALSPAPATPTSVAVDPAKEAAPPAAPARAIAAPPASPAPGLVPGGAHAVLQSDDGDLDSLLGAVAQAHQQLGELRRGLARSAGVGNAKAEDALDQLARALEQIGDGAERLRLTPAARLFMPLQRSVRDAAQAAGKQVAFEGLGGEVRLDGEVLTLVQAALVQMVRNAVAHGIEPAERRLALGKPAQGQVRVQVHRRGRRVAFECSDDGAGLNLEALREQAVRKGWIGPTERIADMQAALALLLRGGLSTAAQVDTLAGRGVGLDVVGNAAARLGGEVQLRSDPGRGTTLGLIVPLRLAALEVLLVRDAGIVLAIPLDAVRRGMRLSLDEVASSPGGRTIAHEGQALPLAALGDALGLVDAIAGRNAGAVRQRVDAVLIEAESGRAVLEVDRIVGAAHVTLRPPPDLVPGHALVAGVSTDLEGRPQLVLDPDGLVAFAQAMPARALAAAGPSLPLLVIDDSLTTRMLEQSILESAGYTVHAAVSAEEGMDLARQRRYALFLVDVEMPGMDGFTFVERTRADPDLRQVPAVLITSLSTPAHKQRGLDAGASGYIVKSEFAQTEFLQLVRRLAGAPTAAG